jgi:hypothetical protein
VSYSLPTLCWYQSNVYQVPEEEKDARGTATPQRTINLDFGGL